MHSHADALLIRRDHALPGLATLLDDDAFTHLLRLYLPGCAVEQAQGHYVRYKAGTNCLVAYRVSIESQETQVYATAYSHSGYDKLQKACQKPHTPGACGPGVLVDDDRLLVIRFLPNDRKLPGLASLWDEEKRHKMLQSLLPQTPALWSGPFQILRYKPERRLVARLEAPGQAALLKLYSECAFAYARRGAKIQGSDGRLVVQQRIQKSRTYAAQTFTWLDGQPMDQCLRQHDSPRQLLEKVAEALAGFHSAASAPGLVEPQHSEIEEVQAAVGSIIPLCPDIAGPVLAIVQQLQCAFTQLSHPNCLIHNDCSADQFVRLQSGNLALLDMDRATTGDPMADLGSFAARLCWEGLTGRLPLKKAESMVEMVVESYQATAPTLFSAQGFRTYFSARLLRLAAEPFRYRHRYWDREIHAIVQMAKEVYCDD
jgi:aminoglycoside phosphotransferase (APT) family kinase protein